VSPFSPATWALGLIAPERSATSERLPELFEVWWARVTDPVHVRAEVDEFGRAWEGANRFRRGDFFKLNLDDDEAETEVL
jgi:hypothetical protein